MDEKTEAQSTKKPTHGCSDSDKAAVGPAWLMPAAPDPVFLGHDLWFKHTRTTPNKHGLHSYDLLTSP